MVEVRRPTPADLDHIAAHVRPQDRVEIAALGETDVRAALERSVRDSVWSLVADTGTPACVFGLAAPNGMLGDLGVPWLIGTPAVTRNRRALMRLAPAYIRHMLQTYPRLVNGVHADNSVSIAWLRHLGFTVHPPVDHNGHQFHPFEMGA